MTNDEMNLLSKCRSYASAWKFHLVELPPAVFDSFMRPIGSPTYRLVASNGKIICTGAIEKISAYFDHAQVLGRKIV